MESHVDYLQAKILWDHLQNISISQSDFAEDISDGLTFASAISLLEPPGDIEDTPTKSIGGITSNDIARYGQRRGKLSKGAIDTLLESLDNILNDVALYFHAVNDPDDERLQSLMLSLDDDIQNEVAIKNSDFQELLSRLDTVVDFYQEAAETHLRLRTSLRETMETIPAIVNANHKASHDLLAVTIEASLLKLFVVRARLRASLYDYTSSPSSNATIADAACHLHKKLVAYQGALDIQEQDVQARLNDYQQLLELVDGREDGFTQVVEDLATVRRETEECRKDLRRLGWTES